MKKIIPSRFALIALFFCILTSSVTAGKYTGLTATSSSGTASAAVDNDMGTRWESAFSDPQWIVIDLGSVKNINVIKIYWEGANAKDYSLSFSEDGIDFSGNLNYTNMASEPRTDIVNGLNIDCRYIKMNGTARNLTYGYSIWELRAFGKILNANEPYQIEILSPKTNIEPKELIQFTANVRDKNGIKISNPDLNWSVTGLGSINATGTFSSLFAGKSLVTVSSKLASESIEILVAEKTNETQQLESASPYKIFRVGNTIKVEGNNINCIYLYDVFGRKLYEEKNTGNSNMEISIPKTNSVLILKIQSQTKIDSYKIM